MHSSLLLPRRLLCLSKQKAFQGANIMTKSLVFLAGVFVAYQRIIFCPYAHMLLTIAMPVESVNTYPSINLPPISVLLTT